jgi:acyl-coenzyme A synthetase/AMP-(fatty) acid ligase
LELSNALAGLAGVSSAVCVIFDDQGQLAIAAFVVPQGSLSSADVHRAARHVLPDTMIPDRIELVASLPMTASNKLDERRLLAEAHLTERPAAAAPVRS